MISPLRYPIIITFCLGLQIVQAQNGQAEYLESKRQFMLGNYAAAKLGFQKLSQDKDFGSYASFYFALAAYKNEESKLAYDMWRQLQINFPNWEQQKEVTFWLASVAFDLQRFDAGFRYLKELPSDLQLLVREQSLLAIPQDELLSSLRLNPESDDLAALLVSSIMQQPYGERDLDLLSELSEKFDLKIPSEADDLPLIKKDQYSIAVVLPFMYESLAGPESVLRNSIIWDLYQGMEIAQQALRKSSIKINLFPFDTKKSAAQTQNIINRGQLEKADVIVGPLYTGPNDVIAQFAAENKVTTINPLSSNGLIAKSNPFYYLFLPAYETQGRVAATYASANFQDNLNAFVYYQTDRDSLVAAAYKSELERRGFKVNFYERLTNESALKVQRKFTEKREIRLDRKYSRQQIDSIAMIPGKFVKSKISRDPATGSIKRDKNGIAFMEYYEERFQVHPDSVGHIFVATSSNVVANNFISLAEVRKDTIHIIGNEDWLSFPTISYNQLERLGISFVSPTLVNRNTALYQNLESDFIDQLGREPSIYHLLGYELIYQVGSLLHQHGKYFQKGLSTNNLITGQLMYGLKYSQYHDNQVVPITKLNNLKLERQTKYLQEEIREED